jgi:hypothetical protein
VDGLRLEGVQVRGAVGPDGLSLGDLDALRGPPSGRRPSLPDWTLNLSDVQLRLDTPGGVLTAALNGAGRLGEDFNAGGQFQLTPPEGSALQGAVTAASAGAALQFTLTAQGDVAWGELTARGVDARVEGSAANDLSTTTMRTTVSAASAARGAVQAETIRLQAEGAFALREDALAPDTGTLSAAVQAGRLAAPGLAADDASLDFTGRLSRDALTARAALTAPAATVADSAVGALSVGGPLVASWGEDGAVRFDADARLEGARLTPEGARRLNAALPELDTLPFGPLLDALRGHARAALSDFTIALPLGIDASGVRLRDPALLNGAGARGLAFEPEGDARIGFDGSAVAAGALRLTANDATVVSIALRRLARAPGGALVAQGALAGAQWRAPEAAFSTEGLALGLTVEADGAWRLTAEGPARMTGPAPGGQVVDLSAPLALTLASGGGAFAVRADGCTPVTFAQYALPGAILADGSGVICPDEAGLWARNAEGRLGGGFTLTQLESGGAIAGEGGAPLRVQSGPVRATWSGSGGVSRLALEGQAPAIDIQFAEGRTAEVRLERVDGALVSGGGGWTAEGRFTGAAYTDPALPATVRDGAGIWSAAPEGAVTVLGMSDATFLIEPPPTAPVGDKALAPFNAIRLQGVAATLRDGVVTAEGDVALAAEGERLGRFTARHRLEDMTGEAQVVAQDLRFVPERRAGPALTPSDITPLALGIVSAMRGEVDAVVDARWTGDDLAVSATAFYDVASLTTRTLPVIEGVRGDVRFDDLLAFQTPPGQSVEIATINPGVALREGKVRYQLLPGGRVAIEDASWAFAGGRLQLDPLTVTLGADQTELFFRLDGVDLANLIEEIDAPDLTATGRVTGSFRVRLTPASAEVLDGRLVSTSGGGTIAYTGTAGATAEGVSRLAFDALRNFRYDTLEILLSGNLGEEMESEVRFTGLAVGDELDLSPIIDLPLLGDVSASEAPFRFNISINAPFMRLGDSAGIAADPRRALDRAQDQQSGPPDDEEDDVDLPPAAPR